MTTREEVVCEVAAAVAAKLIGRVDLDQDEDVIVGYVSRIALRVAHEIAAGATGVDVEFEE